MKFFSCIFLALFVLSCTQNDYKEKFENHYDGVYTGLDTLIDISGEFRTSNYLHHIVFYNDGLVAYPGHTPEKGDYTDPYVWKSFVWAKYIWGAICR